MASPMSNITALFKRLMGRSEPAPAPEPQTAPEKVA
jgi:hypothetical protein